MARTVYKGIVADMTSRLSRIVFMIRGGSAGVASAANFYENAVGLSILRATDDWAELTDGQGVRLHLQATMTESQLSTGYSPLLTFSVTDMDRRVAACAQAGGHLDGPIQYPAHGKVAALRTPDGHMIGLYEPNEIGLSAEKK
mmetsp:Transcript_7214/g.9372  ORF Transcript_7214/g.9372 Transcript_7214/m.9372 type:complete len:143 (+) Transcript_7214:42-470(+)